MLTIVVAFAFGKASKTFNSACVAGFLTKALCAFFATFEVALARPNDHKLYAHPHPLSWRQSLDEG